jgi:energy-coupling factor transporter ATP-binding protein EcfA2
VPNSGATLVSGLELSVAAGESLLIMGPSGAGKTSILRTVAGLWGCGEGEVVRHGQPMGRAEGEVSAALSKGCAGWGQTGRAACGGPSPKRRPSHIYIPARLHRVVDTNSKLSLRG